MASNKRLRDLRAIRSSYPQYGHQVQVRIDHIQGHRSSTLLEYLGQDLDNPDKWV